MEMMDWGFRALGRGRAREGRAEHDRGEWVGEEERVCDLNAVGPNKTVAQPQPVRPVAQTGQTGLAQADRIKFELVICRMSFELMTVVSLIIGD